MAMARSLGVGRENGKMLVKGHKLPVIDKKKFWGSNVQQGDYN